MPNLPKFLLSVHFVPRSRGAFRATAPSMFGGRLGPMVRCCLVYRVNITKGSSRSTDGMRYSSQYADPTLGLECIPGQASTDTLRESGIKGMASVHRAEVILINVDGIQALPIVPVNVSLLIVNFARTGDRRFVCMRRLTCWGHITAGDQRGKV
ncbi:hypothetical protein F4811DRAFT_525447, partial [Daldinia bambusicola]